MPTGDAAISGQCSWKNHVLNLHANSRGQVEQWTESFLLLKKDTARAHPNANAGVIRRNIRSQVKQSPAVGHGDGLGAAQDVQFSEQRLDVALDGDFRDGETGADQFVGLAFR